LWKRLDVLGGQDGEQASMEAKNVQNRMDELLYREELMWLQRSRIAWLKEGDRNTKFFHLKAVARARKNRIKRLRDDDDDRITHDMKEIEGLTTSVFKKLYSADVTVQPENVVQLFN
jgi:cytidylate kinase